MVQVVLGEGGIFCIHTALLVLAGGGIHCSVAFGREENIYGTDGLNRSGQDRLHHWSSRKIFTLFQVLNLHTTYVLYKLV